MMVRCGVVVIVCVTGDRRWVGARGARVLARVLALALVVWCPPQRCSLAASCESTSRSCEAEGGAVGRWADIAAELTCK